MQEESETYAWADFMIVYFSATGNSCYVAAMLARELGGQQMVDMRPYMRKDATCLQLTLDEDEPLCFVFPVHSWGMPKYLAGVLETMKVQGYVPGRNYVCLLATCGDDAGRLYSRWSKSVAKAGLRSDAGFTVFMPNTYVLFPGFDVDRAEVRDRKLAEAPAAVRKVAEQIKAGVRGDFTRHGSMPGVKTGLVYPLFVRFMTDDKAFEAQADVCIGCGRCVEVCPVENITLTAVHPKRKDRRMPVWHGHCLNCLACYHYCPVHAIAYGTKTKGKGVYRCNLK